MSLHAWAECGPDQLTDDELDAKADELADQFEERAHQARKGE